ncbi:VWA domain-containing protein [Pistricoccus aurantiacus]|uniref:VWA domain-containing protein n=1 Tax=Pistricoccus aurantiacus TaxID=1883414 RepID=A0A5B8SNU3_9GAMM|nr:M14 family zinc carboxypeptidase [Pistricoccus aurantiacus]QEA37737.1 VWA domain-containing protein [Pistricoccus aurantiacus]
MAYHNLSEFESGLAALADAYPDTCRLMTLPHATVQGRNVYAVRLGAEGPRPAVFLLGGLHAREWMPPEICLSLAADLLEAFDLGTGLSYGPVSYSPAEIRQIMESYHLYVLPTANPDGLHYSQAVDEIGGAGGWRRNRNPTQSGGAPDCIGVDLNRNYDFLFNFPVQLSPAADTSAISTDPCSLVYHGPSPNSEQETRNIIWMLDTHPQIRWFFDIHSYSELILYNWGHDENQTHDPAMSFLNPAYDGERGVPGDAYREYIETNDLSLYQALSEELRLGIEAVNGRHYSPGLSFGLYPTTGTSTDYVYARHLLDPLKPKVYAFTLETGTEFRPPWSEAEDVIREVSSGLLRFLLQAPCLTWPLRVTAPAPLEIDFLDVPEGLTTYRAIDFEVTGCRSASVRIIEGPRVTSGPPDTAFGTPMGPTSGEADPRPDVETPAHARVWISYTGTNDGDVATGTVRLRCDATDEKWEVAIRANTKARAKVAVMLALDQSASMNAPAGALGASRLEVLREAAARFVELVPPGNALGLVRFDHDAYSVGNASYPGLDITPIIADEVADPGRQAARNAVLAHAANPTGHTSIGDGLMMARNVLAPITGYDEKAIVVFTDGIENRPLSIADASGAIDERTFAIGLGNESQVSTAGLMALAGERDGYLLLTGRLDSGIDDHFRLTKYFLQILAGMTRGDIVRDPSGSIAPGAKQRIPFQLTEADVEATVILLTDLPLLRYWLETPEGEVLNPGVATTSGATYAVGTNMAFYRFGLPLPVGEHSARAGTWQAVLEIDMKRWKRYLAEQGEQKVPRGVRYSLSVHAYSNLRMRARLDQESLAPGGLCGISAVLTEYDLPLERRARIVAEIERPDHGRLELPLDEVEPGIFEAVLPTSMHGLYRICLRASGKSRRGLPFTREQLLTAAILRNDRPAPSISEKPDEKPEEEAPTARPGDDEAAWRRLIACLLSQDGIRALMAKYRLDAEDLRRCLEGKEPREQASASSRQWEDSDNPRDDRQQEDRGQQWNGRREGRRSSRPWEDIPVNEVKDWLSRAEKEVPGILRELLSRYRK